MSIHDENVQAIVDYFKSGIKSAGDSPRLGVEIEHIVVGEYSHPISFSEEYGVRWMLEQLAQDLPNKTFGDDGQLIGLAGEDKTLTLLYPAEICLSDALDRLPSVTVNGKPAEKTIVTQLEKSGIYSRFTIEGERYITKKKK